MKLFAAALVSVLALLSLPLPTADALSHAGVIHVIATGTTYRSLGSGITVEQATLWPRFNPGHPVGRLVLVCTATGRGGNFCNGALRMPLGNVLLSGPVDIRQVFSLGVLGGTRLYNNVQGEAVFVALGKRTFIIQGYLTVT